MIAAREKRPHMARELILILDFGDPSTLIAARMIRAAKVYCEIMPHDTPVDVIRAKAPMGIVAVGGAQDIDSENAPAFPLELLKLGIPVLAIGYAARGLCVAQGGATAGKAIDSQVVDILIPKTELFAGLDSGARYIRRADMLTLPSGYHSLAAVDGVTVAMKRDDSPVYAVQIIPEQNDMDCVFITANFALKICKCSPSWTVQVFVDEAIEKIRAVVGSGRAIISMSGGVDSSVCAALVHRAIGNRLSCLFIDTGLMRKNEPDEVRRIFGESLGINITLTNMAERFHDALAQVTNSDEKRKTISAVMQQTISEEAAKLSNIDYYVSGTIYRDVVSKRSTDISREAISAGGFAGIIEPLRELFKDEVRAVGEMLGLPAQIIGRQPFPGAGLAIRCIGEVTARKLELLREADFIFRSEIESAGLAKSVWQYFAIITDMPDGRDNSHVIVLRAANTADTAHSSIVRLPYELLIKVMDRITQEIPSISRVVYDLTGKPPANVEWE